MIADELLKRDEERRRRRDEGEEEEDEAMEAEPNAARGSEEKPKVVARTRVGLSISAENGLTVQLRFTDSEVAEMKSMGIPTRKSCRASIADARNQNLRLSSCRSSPNRR